MRHKDHRLGSVVNGIFDGGEGANDALVVGDFVTVERDVEIDLRGVSCSAQLQHG
jgi:hypothetical protein